MITNRQVKIINSLQRKKFRKEYQSFIVQGTKSVLELLSFSTLDIDLLLVTEEFKTLHHVLIEKSNSQELAVVTISELEKLGTFETNSSALAVVRMPEKIDFTYEKGEYVLVLDDIRDPGNLGTILRIADWYGIKKVLCSTETVDVYNPKVIAATMGSFSRVTIFYEDLKEVLTQYKGEFIVAAYLEGESIYKMNSGNKGGFIIIGNESKGVSEELMSCVSNKVTIPRIGGAESLNAGIATAIFCDNIIGRNA